MNVKLLESDITTLKEYQKNDDTDNSSNKRNPNGTRKTRSENKNSIVFPAFDLSIKRIGFGNGSTRVTTIAYEIGCHPHHATLTK